MPVERFPHREWLYPILLLAVTTLAWFGMLLGLNTVLGGGGGSFWSQIANFTSSDAQTALGNLPEVVVAILGIAMTVVSIIVQLSATRYTPRVTEMFFRDRTNLVVLGFFVITSLHCVWATFVVHSNFTPQLLIGATVAMMTVSVLVLVPYFIYVFKFLDPERVVARLQAQSLAEARPEHDADEIGARQIRMLQGIEQLADIAINAISNKDRIIASRTVDALRDLVHDYLEGTKGRLGRRWFTIGAELRRNPDFTVMAAPSLEDLSEGNTWVEFKVLRQYQTIFNECLNRMRDVSQLVAIDSRYIGEAAIASGDKPVLRLIVKFFNTFMRAAINAGDVRSAYNLLHQYRQLAEGVLRAGMDQDASELADRFKYYGQTANARGLSFITETAAYDMCALCELAHALGSPIEHTLLATFLDVDKVPETESEEQSLRGVRKAQIKLATYYLAVGADNLAREIWRDMEHERPERLQSIRDELLAVETKDFWEIIDRGDNLDYLDDTRRPQLAVFYSWFESLPPASAASTAARASVSPRDPAEREG